jgi:murein L,D-transpeptidase YcbB/YkuD
MITTHSEAWAATILADIFEIKEEMGTFKGALRSELAEIMQDLKAERDELRHEREAFKKFQAEAIAQIKQATASSGVEISKASTNTANNIVRQLESIKESGLKQFNDSIRWEARTFEKKEILKQAIILTVFFAMTLAICSYFLIPKATTELTIQKMLETFGHPEQAKSDTGTHAKPKKRR